MAERGAFFEGGREPFPGGKKVPFPPQTPPILPKTAHMLFYPTGQSLLRDAPRPKKSGKMPQGTVILSVKSRPGKCPSGGEAGRAETRPCIREKRRHIFPSHHGRPACDACPDPLPPQDKGRPSTGGSVSCLREYARQQKKRLPFRAASDERVLGKEGVWGRKPFFAASSDRRRPQGRARCDEGSYGHRQQSKGVSSPSLYLS